MTELREYARQVCDRFMADVLLIASFESFAMGRHQCRTPRERRRYALMTRWYRDAKNRTSGYCLMSVG